MIIYFEASEKNVQTEHLLLVKSFISAGPENTALLYFSQEFKYTLAKLFNYIATVGGQLVQRFKPDLLRITYFGKFMVYHAYITDSLGGNSIALCIITASFHCC